MQRASPNYRSYCAQADSGTAEEALALTGSPGLEITDQPLDFAGSLPRCVIGRPNLRRAEEPRVAPSAPSKRTPIGDGFVVFPPTSLSCRSCCKVTRRQGELSTTRISWATGWRHHLALQSSLPTRSRLPSSEKPCAAARGFFIDGRRPSEQWAGRHRFRSKGVIAWRPTIRGTATSESAAR